MTPDMQRMICRRPGLWQTAANACRALMRMTVRSYQGDPLLAPEAVKEARLRICRGCVCNAEDRRRCEVCGCFVIAKVMFTTERCPKGYWS